MDCSTSAGDCAIGDSGFFDLSTGNQDIISLGVGEPDFVTPEHVRAACIRALNNGETMYTPNSGLLELRDEIASYLHTSFKLRYEPNDEIMVTVGKQRGCGLGITSFHYTWG